MKSHKVSGKNKVAPLMMADVDIPINRSYSYVRCFFKEKAAVLQGIAYPLQTKPFKGGKLKLDRTIQKLGAPRRRVDARNISYVAGGK